MLVVLKHIHIDVMTVVVRLIFKTVHSYLDVIILSLLTDVLVEDVLPIKMVAQKMTHNLVNVLKVPNVVMTVIVEPYVLFMMVVLNLKHHSNAQLEDV